jgi:hypothetical protein
MSSGWPGLEARVIPQLSRARSIAPWRRILEAIAPGEEQQAGMAKLRGRVALAAIVNGFPDAY